MHLKLWASQDFPDGPVVEDSTLLIQGAQIPDWETKILHAALCCQKDKKQTNKQKKHIKLSTSLRVQESY